MTNTFDYGRLRGKIVEKYDTVENFSGKFGQTSTTVGRKLSGKSEWSQSDIIRACDLLNIRTDEISAYFFTKKVEFSQQST